MSFIYIKLFRCRYFQALEIFNNSPHLKGFYNENIQSNRSINNGVIFSQL